MFILKLVSETSNLNNLVRSAGKVKPKVPLKMIQACNSTEETGFISTNKGIMNIS